MSSELGLATQIKELAIHSTGWRHHNPVKKAYEVYDKLNEKFFGGDLPQCIIGLDDNGRIQRDGVYYYEGDSVSLPHHIDLMPGLSAMGTIVALLKNMEHLNSEVYKVQKSWYHSLSWRKAMKEFGLVCKANGEVTEILPEFRLLVGAVDPNYTDDSYDNWRAQYLADGAKQATLDKESASANTFVPETSYAHPTTGHVVENVHSTGVVKETLVEQGYVPYGDVVAKTGALHTTPAKPAEPKVKAKAVFKWACACVKGIAPSGERGTTSFWTTRVHPDSKCGACGSGFTVQD